MKVFFGIVVGYIVIATITAPSRQRHVAEAGAAIINSVKV